MSEGKDKPIERRAVKSSQLKSVGFCADRKCVEVEFNNGAVYRYPDCDQQLFDSLINAESIGKHFNSTFRSRQFTKQS